MKLLALAISLCACHGSPPTLVPLGQSLDAGRCDLRIACYDGVVPERCEPGVPEFEPTPEGCQVVRCFGEQFPLPDGGCLSADCAWSDSAGVTCSPAVGCDLMPRSEDCSGSQA